MPPISHETVLELAAVKGNGAPVTSCYIDVDGRRLVRQQDLDLAVDSLLRPVRERHAEEPSVQADLDRISHAVKHGLDRSGTRGVAAFSCSADDFWFMVPLRTPVRDQVVVNRYAAVGQLEALVQDHEPMGVLLADRQRARMMVFALGELVDRSEVYEELPRDVDTVGVGDRAGDHAGALEEAAHQHLRNAARLAFGVFQSNPFEHLLLGGPEHVLTALERHLHPYLKKRLSGRIGVTPTASEEDIRAAAESAEAEIVRRREAELVERLRQAVATGRRGVAGLDAVLEALANRRVDRLLVSSGYEQDGWRCPSCGALARVGRRCSRCGSEMHQIGDIVEEAVEEALNQSCRVEVCNGNADLDVLGRIGALLRY